MTLFRDPRRRSDEHDVLPRLRVAYPYAGPKRNLAGQISWSWDDALLARLLADLGASPNPWGWRWPSELAHGAASSLRRVLRRDREGALSEHVTPGVENPYVVCPEGVAGPGAQIHAGVVSLVPAAVGLLVEEQSDVLGNIAAIDLDVDRVVDPDR